LGCFFLQDFSANEIVMFHETTKIDTHEKSVALWSLIIPRRLITNSFTRYSWKDGDISVY